MLETVILTIKFFSVQHQLNMTFFSQYVFRNAKVENIHRPRSPLENDANNSEYLILDVFVFGILLLS